MIPETFNNYGDGDPDESPEARETAWKKFLAD
jgi:hypothetical protein